jgi:hypothetical protein
MTQDRIQYSISLVFLCGVGVLASTTTRLFNNFFHVGFGALTVVSIKCSIFWNATPCNLVEVYRRFGESSKSDQPSYRSDCCFFLAGRFLSCFKSEGRDIALLRNVSRFLPDCRHRITEDSKERKAAPVKKVKSL